MKYNKGKKLLHLFEFLNLVLVTTPFKTAWATCYAVQLHGRNTIESDLLIMLMFFCVYATFLHIYDGFVVSTSRIYDLVLAQWLSITVTDSIIFFVVWIALGHFPSVIPMLLTLALQYVCSLIWCFLVQKWHFKVLPPRKTLMIQSVKSNLVDLVNEFGFYEKFDIVQALTIEELQREQYRSLDGMEAVFAFHHSDDSYNCLLKECQIRGISIYLMPDAGDVILHSAKSSQMFHRAMFKVKPYNPSLAFEVEKRITDIILSLIGFILTSPVILLTAIAIKAYDGGPVFYRQERLTKGGRHFYILKFRSMRVDAEKDGVARLSTGDNDDRITPVGRFIRKVRIDELPQLLNILKGDLSIVGPRPERPELTEQYMEELPEFALRLQAKAGLTGYAQIYGRYNTTPEDKLLMDLIYMDHPSAWKDLKIMVATVKTLLTPESTEGVEVGQTTALK